MRHDLERHSITAARWIIHQAFEAWTEEGWGNYLPDVGQYDFEHIIEVAESLLPADTTIPEYRAAYTFFKERANDDRP